MVNSKNNNNPMAADKKTLSSFTKMFISHRHHDFFWCRQKRRKNSSHANADAKRHRFDAEEENSADENDPIDVNKFLASDGIRIKEERNFDESFGDYDQVSDQH